MIEKFAVNYKMDWDSSGAVIRENGKSVKEERIDYLTVMRQLLEEIDSLGISSVKAIFRKYNVHKVNIDEYPRINVDYPKENA